MPKPTFVKNSHLHEDQRSVFEKVTKIQCTTQENWHSYLSTRINGIFRCEHVMDGIAVIFNLNLSKRSLYARKVLIYYSSKQRSLIVRDPERQMSFFLNGSLVSHVLQFVELRYFKIKLVKQPVTLTRARPKPCTDK